MKTNGGKVIVKKTGVVPSFGQVWYDRKIMANILGLFQMTKEHCCTMDTAVKNCINVHSRGGITKFKTTLKGLYCWEPTKVCQDKISQMKMVEVCNLVSSVQENWIGFTAQHVEEAN
jgi:hypothetical protein